MALLGRKRARTQDRDQAVEVINAAYAQGQLTDAEREDRVHRALVATHVGDLAQVTADLQPAQKTPQTSQVSQHWWQRTSTRTKLAVGAAALVLVGGGVAATQTGGDEPVAVVEAPYFVPVTAEAFTDLVADQEAEFGTTRSYGVNLQEQISTVAVPTDDGRARFQEWRPREDGTFAAHDDPQGAGEYREFDLADVDVEALEATMDEAWGSLKVPEPTRIALVVQHWEPHDEPRITVNVSNDYDEHGYVVTDLAGSVVERREFDPASP